MIHLIEIENFLSIRDTQIIDLRVSAKVEDKFARFGPIFPGSVTKAPKVVALFGANASGKTNVFKALNFVIQLVRDSKNTLATLGLLERFNDEASKNRPIRVAIEMAGLMDATPEMISRAENGADVCYGTYRYEIEIAVREGFFERVQRESVRQRPEGKGKWQRVFERDGNGKVLGSRAFPIAGYTHLLNTLDPRGSIVPNFAQFQHPGALNLQNLAKAALVLLDLGPSADDNLIAYLGQRPNMLERLNRDLNRIDLGIEEMRVDTGTGAALARFRHSKLDEDLPWLLESQGTRAFIRVYPLIAETLATGGVAMIDELDHRIHPNVLPEIIRWFHDPFHNPDGAQLWLTGQSATLLDDLVPEEVLFCEKDRAGRTSLYLANQVARRSDNLRRKYLAGAYGAVPHIG